MTWEENIMDDKNDKKTDGNGEGKTPLEIPDNEPPTETEPIKARNTAKKQKATMNKVKVAYAIALVLALGAAFTAKIATEKTLGSLGELTTAEYSVSEKTGTKDIERLETDPDFEVRQNLTDVPDTREETKVEETKEPTTEKVTEKSKYAEPYKDYFELPLGTDILKEYQPDTPSYNATMGDWRTHAGIDFQGTQGAQVKSIAYGTVTAVYDDAIFGTTIEIDHGNGVLAKYCGFNKDTLEIKKGVEVKSGTLLGYLGTVPCEKTDLSHLHFEIIYNGKNVDPLELMNK